MPEPFRFTSPLQERVYRRLKLLGAGPAAFFIDACRLMAVPEAFGTTTHLVGHLLREIESSLRDVLGIVVEAPIPKTKDDKHVAEVRAILGTLGFAEDDPAVERWLYVAGRGAPGALHRRAHRDNLNAPRFVDDEFARAWEDIQLLLDAVLDRLETRYADIYARLDVLLAISAPNGQHLRDLGSIPTTPATYGYFFERLSSPDWLTPLAATGYFASPPPAEPGREPGTVVFPFWPQANYLARVAAQHPDVVEDIVRALPGTDNPRVYTDLLRVLQHLPADRAADLLPVIEPWISVVSRYHFGDEAIHLAAHLAQNGAAAGALRLTRVLLGLPADGDPSPPPPKLDVTAVRELGFPWHLSEIPKALGPKLLDAAGLQYIELLADALDHHVGRPTSTNGEECAYPPLGFHDYSTFWLPSVARVGRKRESDLRVLLADELRRGIAQLGGEDPTIIPNLVEVLRSHPAVVFRRLEFHLLAEHPEAGREFVVERLSSRQTFEEPDVSTEVAGLLRGAYHLLPDNSRQQVLDWLQEGPELSWLSDPEARAARQAQWKRDWLSLISDHLPGPAREMYEGLVATYGPPRPLERQRSGATWVGPQSPISPEQLNAMSVADLITYLSDWEPSPKWEGPSAEGLARHVSERIKAEPAAFAGEALRFRGLAEPYIDALLSGLSEARRNDLEFTWGPVLDLAASIVDSSTHLGEGGETDSVPGGRESAWSRRMLAELLSEGLTTEPGGIPFQERPRVWHLIEQLADDPDPTPEHEAEFGGTNMDPATLALNTVRPAGIDAAIRYAFWVFSNLHKDATSPDAGFADAPEAAALLEQHLDLGKDPSPAVRAAIGKWLSQLIWFDRRWVEKQLPRLLPEASDATAYRDALWDAFVKWGNLTGDVLPLLTGAYRSAIQRTGSERTPPRSTWGDDPNDKVAEHVVELYWWGLVPLSEPGNLVEFFFQQADAKRRKRAIHHIGMALRGTAEPIDPAPLALIRNLWEWRFPALAATVTDRDPQDPESLAASAELGEFGSWFTSEAFDVDWSLRYLQKVLALTGGTDHDTEVLERLAALSAEWPTDTIACLASIDPDNQDEPWRLHLALDDVKMILRNGLKSEDEPTQRSAREMINRWVARGYTDFRMLLDEE